MSVDKMSLDEMAVIKMSLDGIATDKMTRGDACRQSDRR
jgi:hypothetical protein